MARLNQDFFTGQTVDIARALLGQDLVHEVQGTTLIGRIVEVEAYAGAEDMACHGYRGLTPRNAPLFGEVGQSYVYLIYGMYWLFNVIAKPADAEDYPGAILIRALEPLEGLERMAENRKGRSPKEWTSGPGRLTLAMEIDDEHNRIDLMASKSPLYFRMGEPVPEDMISSGPRIGLGKHVTEPWKSMPWRFWVRDNTYVSYAKA